MAHDIKNRLKQAVRTPIFKKRVQSTKVQKQKAFRPNMDMTDAMSEYLEEMEEDYKDSLYQEDLSRRSAEDPLHMNYFI